jgi:hypothetical protein
MKYSALTEIAVAVGVFFATWVVLTITSGIILGLMGYAIPSTCGRSGQGCDVEQSYKNALVVITVRLFETLQPEVLAKGRWVLHSVHRAF